MKNHFKLNQLSRLFVVFFIILQSCNSIPKIQTNCKNLNLEVSKRYALFKTLSQKEIQERSEVHVTSYSQLDDFSVFSKIVEAIENAKPNAKFIPVDLRGYKSVILGNVIISNIKGNLSLKFFLKTSKYSQGFFALVNFGKNKVTILGPTFGAKNIQRKEIKRSDLQNVELVLNTRNSGTIMGNMKFNEGQKISLLAKNIKKPFAIDLREASNGQYNLGQKWIMSVYDISQSEIKNGKDTSGYYLYVNNNQTKNISLSKFNKSQVACYSNPHGFKFEESINK